MSSFKCSGYEYQILNVSVDTNDTVVSLSRPVKSFIIQNRGENDVYWRRNSGDSAYWTLKAGSSMTFEIERSRRTVSTVLGYARAVTGTVILEVLTTY